MSQNEIPLLSEGAADALLEFFEQQCNWRGDTQSDKFEEDWNLSQFWYTEETASTLCAELEAVFANKADARIACVSCPTLFRQCLKRESGFKSTLFEFDTRFAKLGDFAFYDYNNPEALDSRFVHAFDAVVADPPYLSEECLVKTLKTAKFLLREDDQKLYLLTGEVMKEVAFREAGLRPVEFRPKHENKLGNAFVLYTNYQPCFHLGTFI